jgi:Zn-dependent protease with chaperone function
MAWASVAAGVATLALRPRSGLIKPAPVEAREYFSREEIDRARAYQRPQRLLGLLALALEGGALTLVVVRPPARLQDAIAHAGNRPVRGAAALGAGMSLGSGLLSLPLSATRHKRAVNAGISVQKWGAWLSDVGKASAIGAALNAGALAGAMALVRRYPTRWWAPAAAGASGLSAVFMLVSPVLLDPVFNKFERLPDGDLRSEVLDLAGRAGVEVGEVYRVDASRRTTAANAYVTGLGRTKRVVLFDTLLGDFPPAEVRSVVAHELSHVRHRDVQRALAWLAIVAPAGLHLVQRLTERITPRPVRRRRRHEPGPEILPALVLTLGGVSFAGNIAVNALSRKVENRADKFALDLTEDPDAFIELERRLAIKALADPQPPRLLQKLFGTHPSTLERIGYGLAWKKTRG